MELEANARQKPAFCFAFFRVPLKMGKLRKGTKTKLANV